MHDGVVLAADRWATNADLIADCFKLGHLKDELTLDPTYGKGNWWKTWRPTDLVKHDAILDGSDFRNLPYSDETFPQIAYDPPYVSVGGRASSGVQGMYAAYGLLGAPNSPRELQEVINDGLMEMFRLAEPGGRILVKCQDYVSSGKLWLGTYLTLDWALALGLECIDRMEHIGNPRPQPARSRQIHARRNLSTLFVFKKGK